MHTIWIDTTTSFYIPLGLNAHFTFYQNIDLYTWLLNSIANIKFCPENNSNIICIAVSCINLERPNATSQSQWYNYSNPKGNTACKIDITKKASQ